MPTLVKFTGGQEHLTLAEDFDQAHRSRSRRGSNSVVSTRPAPAERLANPDARSCPAPTCASSVSSGAPSTPSSGACPIVALPGYSRPLIRVADYQALLASSTFDGTRVR
jgi:hypothetical protein